MAQVVAKIGRLQRANITQNSVKILLACLYWHNWWRSAGVK